jgi:hypothetical protein
VVDVAHGNKQRVSEICKRLTHITLAIIWVKQNSITVSSRFHHHNPYTWGWPIRPKRVVMTVKGNQRCTQTAKGGRKVRHCGGRGGKRKTYFTDGGGCGLLRLFHDTVSIWGYVAPNGGTRESLIITDLDGCDSVSPYYATALWTFVAFSVS